MKYYAEDFWKEDERYRIITVDQSIDRPIDTERALTIKDPFDEPHNPGRVKSDSREFLVAKFKEAYDLLKSGKKDRIEGLFQWSSLPILTTSLPINPLTFLSPLKLLMVGTVDYYWLFLNKQHHAAQRGVEPADPNLPLAKPDPRVDQTHVQSQDRRVIPATLRRQALIIPQTGRLAQDIKLRGTISGQWCTSTPM